MNLNNAGGFGSGTYRIISESSTVNFTPLVFSIGTVITGFQEKFSNPGGTEMDMIVSSAPIWKADAVSRTGLTSNDGRHRSGVPDGPQHGYRQLRHQQQLVEPHSRP